jgi:hypothetical protein
VAATEILGFSSAALLPAFARDVFLVGSVGLGLMTASKSLGAVGGLVVIAIRGPLQKKGLLLVVASGSLGAALVLFAASPIFGIALVSVCLAGAAAAAVDTLAQTLLQDSSGPNQRGAAMGVWLFSVGFGPVGFVAMGALATAWGAAAVQVVGGVLLLGVATLASSRPVATLE